MSISPDRDWKIETTWNWLLQTMLAIKILPTDNPRTSGVHYGTGLYTLHHLLTRRSCLTNQQSKNAWFILGRGEIPDLYAHLICDQLHDTDRNALYQWRIASVTTVLSKPLPATAHSPSKSLNLVQLPKRMIAATPPRAA